MSLRLLEVYDHLPAWLKFLSTHAYILARRIRERAAARSISRTRRDCGHSTRVVYMSGMHRSGTSLLKTYFAGAPGIVYRNFDPRGFHYAWRDSAFADGILVDKSNHYIEITDLIYGACGDQAAFCNVVRDPRDTLASLFEWPESRDIPRDARFFTHAWGRLYGDFLEFGGNSPDARLYLIRYEDLVRWPAKAKMEFLQWLSLRPCRELGDRYEARPSDRGVEPGVKTRDRVVPDSIGRWRTEVDPDFQRIVRTWNRSPWVADLMQRLGYGPDGVEDRPLAAPGIRCFQPDLSENPLPTGNASLKTQTRTPRDAE